MKFSLFILLCLLHFFSADAQYFYLGAASNAQANTLVAEPNTASVYNNPAAMANLETSNVTVSYQQLFPIEGLNLLGFYGLIANPKLTIGFCADQFGDAYYHESRAGIALAKKQDRVAMGIKISYLNSGIKEFSSKKTALTEFGIWVKLSSKINVGMHVLNLTNAKLYETQSLPTTVNLGINLKASKQVNINTQCEYPVGLIPHLRVGMNYAPKENFQLMAGVNPLNKVISFGLSLKVKGLQLVYGLSTHPVLGLANHFSLTKFFLK